MLEQPTKLNCVKANDKHVVSYRLVDEKLNDVEDTHDITDRFQNNEPMLWEERNN
jgi:hypothetical protein